MKNDKQVAMIKVGLLEPGLFTSYIPKVGEFFNNSIYSLLVKFPELGGQLRHWMQLISHTAECSPH